MSLFLTKEIPNNYAITLYFSLPPYNEMQYLGAVANQKSSDTFTTGFPFKPELEKVETVKLCLRAQTIEEIANLVRVSDGQREYSKLVAHNLYNFMMSFHIDGLVNTQGKQFLVIPTEVFTKWMNKFD